MLSSKSLFYSLLPLPNLPHPSFWALKVRIPKMFILNTIEFIHRFSFVLFDLLCRFPFTMTFSFVNLFFPWRFWEYFGIPLKILNMGYLQSIFIVIYLWILWVTLPMCAKDVIVNNHRTTVWSCTSTFSLLHLGFYYVREENVSDLTFLIHNPLYLCLVIYFFKGSWIAFVFFPFFLMFSPFSAI